jgi:glyoxylase-like metal-dependent hydrolase (beta-lactamase superfamily II)
MTTYGHTEILFGEKNGKYPHGNSMLVRGAEETIVVDPSISLIPRRAELPRVDRVVNSHCHEDHVAGNHLFPESSWWLHELDLPGILSLEGIEAIYGYAAPIMEAFRPVILRDFHFTPRPDAVPYRDGDVFELGGGVRVRVVHTPGHTRGHCCLHVEPDDVLYLGDIDLSSFGPYYGDAWSDLEDFERSLALVRRVEARWYATFHHIGVVDRPTFLERLDRFTAVIADRDRRLLEYLREPHTLDEIAAHRFIYRPQDPVPFAEAVERRSMGQHVERLLRDGRLREVDAGVYSSQTS